MGMATFILDEIRRKEARKPQPVVPTPPAVQKPVVQAPVSEPPLTAQAKPEPAPEPVKAVEPKVEPKAEPKKEETKKKDKIPQVVWHMFTEDKEGGRLRVSRAICGQYPTEARKEVTRREEEVQKECSDNEVIAKW